MMKTLVSISDRLSQAEASNKSAAVFFPLLSSSRRVYVSCLHGVQTLRPCSGRSSSSSSSSGAESSAAEVTAQTPSRRHISVTDSQESQRRLKWNVLVQ